MPTRTFAAAVILGLVARLALLVSSIGTSDVVYKTVWAKLAWEHGTFRAYAATPFLNDPPLALGVSRWLYRASEQTAVAFGDSFRAIQILADAGSLACLIVLARRLGLSRPRAVALFYFLSPPAIVISGFHCNADPAMLFFTLLALVLLSAGYHLRSGVALGLAAGVKVVPLLLVPLFFFAIGRRFWKFLLGFLATFAAIFGPAFAIGGQAVYSNIFEYRGVGNWWGIISMLRALSRTASAEARSSILSAEQVVRIFSQYLLLAFIAFVLVLLWRRGETGDGHGLQALVGAIGIVFASVIFFGTGFGVQYLLWPVPFVILTMGRRVAVLVIGVISVFLLTVYTHWAGGFPWWFANSDAPSATTDALVFLGWIVWTAIGLYIVTATRQLAMK